MATRNDASYKASDITVLEGLDPVRKRPGMYIGSTGPTGPPPPRVGGRRQLGRRGHGRGLHPIEVTLLADGGVRVSDNGRGIPVDKHKTSKQSALTTVLTTLHSGGKFEAGAYQVSGGLHGVGVSVVNALSRRLDAEIRRDGFVWTQTFENGNPQGAVKKGKPVKRTGTTITFWPSQETFNETTEFNFQTIVPDCGRWLFSTMDSRSASREPNARAMRRPKMGRPEPKRKSARRP